MLRDTGMSLKVLLFSADYVPDPGGIAGHVYHLARALHHQGEHVTVVGGHVLPCDDSSPAGVGEIRIRRVGPRAFRAAWFSWRAHRILNSLKNQKWDVLHYHNPFPDGLILRNFRAAKVRIFTNHSDAFLRAYESGQKREWLHFLVAGADGIIAPSEEIAKKSQDFFRETGARTKYIPNGVDTALFAPGPQSPNAEARLGARPGDDVILLAVRRHDPKCGLEYLIRAMPSILSSEPRALLCLVGNGREEARLKALAGELGCGNRVRFVGRVENDKLPALYRAAYLSILPSVYEAVSLSGLESLACGCPVVGTNVGGIPAFVIDGETGVLVEPKSQSSLAAGVSCLLRSPELRKQMALSGRTLVEQNFSWESVAVRTLDFYRGCMKTANTGSTKALALPRPASLLGEETQNEGETAT